MTDEQKAIKYTIKAKLEYNNILSQPLVIAEIEKAYIAGLKAGREETKENKCKNKHVCSDNGQSVPCYKVNVCEYCNLWESKK